MSDRPYRDQLLRENIFEIQLRNVGSIIDAYTETQELPHRTWLYCCEGIDCRACNELMAYGDKICSCHSCVGKIWSNILDERTLNNEFATVSLLILLQERLKQILIDERVKSCGRIKYTFTRSNGYGT